MISGATYPGVPQVVVASYSGVMNLARPKSETLIIETSGFFEEYNKFSGYRERMRSRNTYFNVSVDYIHRVAVLNGINDRPNSFCCLLLTVKLFFKNSIK